MANRTNTIMDNVKGIFSDFISQNIPRKLSNLFWQLWNGIEAVLTHQEWKIDHFIRESNILTAQHKSSLRSLAAQNGFEPTLKIPSKGLVRLEINQSLYNRYGSPLYLIPYAVFKCKDNGMNYYYNSDKSMRLTLNSYDIPLVQGDIETIQIKGEGVSIQRIYLTNDMIADGSITITVGNTTFVEVKSFYDNNNLNDNKQFLVKYSHNTQKPIILYVKGLELNDTAIITYRTTYGVIGNLSSTAQFETSDIITSDNEEVSWSNEDMNCYNIYGFSLGSDGNDENSLRAAVGFNHGSDLLFDNISYRNFINKFSTLVLQTIKNDEERKSINYIYVYKKQCLSSSLHSIVDDYKSCIDKKDHILTSSNKQELSDIISEHEYCLTSHEIKDPLTIKYAFQIKYKNLIEKNNHWRNLEEVIYGEFSKFLYEKTYSFSFEELMLKYQKENNITFDYYIFVSNNEYSNSTIISADKYLPILKGDFDIETEDGIITMFFDINHVCDTENIQ